MPFRKRYRIKYLVTTSLHPNPCSAPKHSDKQIAQLATSIEQYEELAAIVIEAMLINIANPDRWLARQRRRYPEAAEINAGPMNEKETAAFGRASKRLCEILISAQGRI